LLSWSKYCRSAEPVGANGKFGGDNAITVSRLV
jgi:hypothetical protein